MDINSELQQEQKQKNTFDYAFGIGMGILVGIGVVSLLLVTNVIRVPSLQRIDKRNISTNTAHFATGSNPTSAQPTDIQAQQTAPQPTEDMTCPAQVKKYLQLSGDYYTVDGVHAGTMNGILKRVDYNVTTKSATVEIESADGRDTYTFSLSDDAVRLSNMITHQYYTSLAELPLNQHIEISYDCNTNDNLFTIIGITIVVS